MLYGTYNIKSYSDCFFASGRIMVIFIFMFSWIFEFIYNKHHFYN